jgi:hypothetical protein
VRPVAQARAAAPAKPAARPRTKPAAQALSKKKPSGRR